MWFLFYFSILLRVVTTYKFTRDTVTLFVVLFPLLEGIMDFPYILQSNVRVRIIRELCRHRYEGITLSELSERLGISKSLLKYHLDRLVSLGIVYKIRRGRYKINEEFIDVFQKFSIASQSLNRYVLRFDDRVELIREYLINTLKLSSDFASQIEETLLSYPRIYLDEGSSIIRLLCTFLNSSDFKMEIMDRYYLIPKYALENSNDLIGVLSKVIKQSMVLSIFPDYLIKYIHNRLLSIDSSSGFLFPERLYINSVTGAPIFAGQICIDIKNPFEALFLRGVYKSLMIRCDLKWILDKSLLNDVLPLMQSFNSLYISFLVDEVLNVKTHSRKLSSILHVFRNVLKGSTLILGSSNYIYFPDGLYINNNRGENIAIVSRIVIDHRLLEKNKLLEELLQRTHKYILQKYRLVYSSCKNYDLYVNIEVPNLILLPVVEFREKYSNLRKSLEKVFEENNNFRVLLTSCESRGVISPQKIIPYLKVLNGFPPLKLIIEDVNDFKLTLSYISDFNFPLVVVKT